MNKRADFNEINKEQNNRIQLIRNVFSIMYDTIDMNCKNNKETQEAYKRLEEAQFWAIKGISREEE